ARERRARALPRRGRTQDGEDARPAHARGSGRAEFDPAHGLQGAPRDRRPRGVSRDADADRGSVPLSRNVASLALVDRVQAGEPAAVARLISRAESGRAEAREALARIYRLAGEARGSGLTRG